MRQGPVESKSRAGRPGAHRPTLDQSIATTLKAPATRPCTYCPYRRDCPSGVWSEADYWKLPQYDEPTAFQPARMFQCHLKDRDATGGRVCGGWAACHNQQRDGFELLSLRMAPAWLPLRAVTAILQYTSPVPLFSSGREAATHGLAEIAHPSRRAREAIEKIMRMRSDVKIADGRSASVPDEDSTQVDERMDAIRRLAARHCPRPLAVDGQCIERAPLVTADLTAAGHTARETMAWGWSDKATRVVGFLHVITVVDTAGGPVVVDATATQFDPDLPAPWVSPAAEYAEQLARATGVADVTLGIDGLDCA